MKSFTAAAAFALVALTQTNAAIVGANTTASTQFTTVDVTSTFGSGNATTVTVGGSSPTGGFVVTGIYTTCLTLTFDAPGPTGIPTASVSTVTAPVVTARNAKPVTSSSLVESGGAVTSTIIASSVPTAPVAVAVFTTCLAFLPTSVSASASSSYSIGTPTTIAVTLVPTSTTA
ncbi:hypothetical protein C8R46DRAFT_1357716 [Mycena filopes]|nr:hypothetical protein C8R46DRAFT_1357716 [Mycena filopes]